MIAPPTFLSLLAVAGLAAARAFATEPVVFAYLPEWCVYDRQYLVKNLEASGSAAKLDVLAYAFAKIGADHRAAIADAYAGCEMAYGAGNSVDGVADDSVAGALRGSLNQLRKLKLMHPKLRLVISVGGWTFSDRFSDMALTAAGRAAFAASCIDRFIDGNVAAGVRAPGIFDGLDIDWEYPGSPGNTAHFRPEDTQNFSALLAELRAALDQRGKLDGKLYSLSAALPAGTAICAKIELGKIHASLDWLNLMAYDFHGAWEARTGPLAALHASPDDPARDQAQSCDRAVRAYLAAGVPAGKINLGVPFYGRGWREVAPGPRGDGLFQAAGGAAKGSSADGIDDYRILAGVATAATTFRDSASKACWSYDPATRILWSYDDPAALVEKMRYVLANHLGGAMCWELSGDDPTGSLLGAVRGGLDGR